MKKNLLYLIDEVVKLDSFWNVNYYLRSMCICQPEIQIEYTVADSEKCKNELLADAVADSMKKADVLAKSN